MKVRCKDCGETVSAGEVFALLRKVAESNEHAIEVCICSACFNKYYQNTGTCQVCGPNNPSSWPEILSPSGETRKICQDCWPWYEAVRTNSGQKSSRRRKR